MTPGRDAPVTCTGVPIGSEAEVQPLVAVFPPVPEQCAACPMYTLPASKKTKFAVHCAPLVKVCTPGWIAAVAAGAHVGAALASVVSVATAAATSRLEAITTTTSKLWARFIVTVMLLPTSSVETALAADIEGGAYPFRVAS
jgi:hypothetical protein